MAYARDTFAGNGTNRLFNVNFPYLATSHVEVYVNGVAATFTWINTTTVQLTTAPANGAVVVVTRNTPKTTRLVDWADGANIREADLDLADLQALYNTQEALDAAERSLPQDISDVQYDAGNKRIKNVATPTAGSDAATKDYADTVNNAVAGNASTASAAASTATTQAGIATTQAGIATTQAGIATTKATEATTAAASAQAAANAVIWRDVVFLTVANSPYTVTAADRSKFFAVDCSGGNVTVNLPEIAIIDLTTQFVIGFKKTDATGNSITINRGGADTIDGSASKSIAARNSGTTIIADIDPNPDQWVSADFGATVGNLAFDPFTGNGSQTVYTLSQAPGADANLATYVSGIRQRPGTDFTTSGTSLTFAVAPPNGAPIYAFSVGTLSIGVPSDNSVTGPKIQAQAVSLDKLARVGTAGQVLTSNGAGADPSYQPIPPATPDFLLLNSGVI